MNDLISERFNRARKERRKLYTIQFVTPGGNVTTVTATNETLQDLMVGPLSRSEESRLRHRPTADKELAGVAIKYVGEKAPFEFRNEKPTPKKPSAKTLIAAATVLANLA